MNKHIQYLNWKLYNLILKKNQNLINCIYTYTDPVDGCEIIPIERLLPSSKNNIKNA